MVSEELWMPWSDFRQEYNTEDATDSEAMCDMRCTWKNRLNGGPGDWRPVRIPTPSQIEATADLLAACEAVISAGESENLPIAVYDAIEAAIAKANGEEE